MIFDFQLYQCYHTRDAVQILFGIACQNSFARIKIFNMSKKMLHPLGCQRLILIVRGGFFQIITNH